jgi:hypothetical protein
MKCYKDKIGTIVTNYGSEFEEVLGIRGVKHIGNFVFTGVTGGTEVTVTAEPVDETEDALRVTGIKVEDGGRPCLGVTYRMSNGERNTVESYVEIPMTKENYRTVAHPGSQSGKELTELLSCLVRLQGYERIATISFDIEVE